MKNELDKNRWRTIESMPEGRFYLTKIDDQKGERNVQRLKKQGNLYFSTDGMYVYYSPTHWYSPYL